MAAARARAVQVQDAIAAAADKLVALQHMVFKRHIKINDHFFSSARRWHGIVHPQNQKTGGPQRIFIKEIKMH
ncbi:hypothetical protein RugamoR1_32540 [Rugamonas sp. R1(2021)]